MLGVVVLAALTAFPPDQFQARKGYLELGCGNTARTRKPGCRILREPEPQRLSLRQQFLFHQSVANSFHPVGN